LHLLAVGRIGFQMLHFAVHDCMIPDHERELEHDQAAERFPRRHGFGFQHFAIRVSHQPGLVQAHGVDHLGARIAFIRQLRGDNQRLGYLAQRELVDCKFEVGPVLRQDGGHDARILERNVLHQVAITRIHGNRRCEQGVCENGNLGFCRIAGSEITIAGEASNAQHQQRCRHPRQLLSGAGTRVGRSILRLARRLALDYLVTFLAANTTFGEMLIERIPNHIRCIGQRKGARTEIERCAGGTK